MPAKKSGKTEFLVVWEFRVKSGKRREFERMYDSDGDWARLFRRSEDYIRTELIRDLKTPGRYLTLDVWISRQAYTRFKKENEAEYRAIDESCASLTENELQIGEFQSSASEKQWRS
jgi:heme-degrading monooxygenase HmoA